jgi:hypothetical protein
MSKTADATTQTSWFSIHYPEIISLIETAAETGGRSVVYTPTNPSDDWAYSCILALNDLGFSITDNSNGSESITSITIKWPHKHKLHPWPTVVPTSPQPQTTQTLIAKCNSDLNIGDLVNLSLDLDGVTLMAKISSCLRRETLPVTGIVIDKKSPTSATVFLSGIIQNLLSNLTPQKFCFVGLNGEITQSLSYPTFKDVKLYIQSIGVAISHNMMIFNPDFNLKVFVG